MEVAAKMDDLQKMYRNVPTPVNGNLCVSVSTPDGGLLYAGYRCINFIGPRPGPGEVRTMSTRINLISLDISPNWGKPNDKNKPFAIVGDDLSVLVWDCELGVAVSGHNAHQHQQEAARNLRLNSGAAKVVLMGYLANGNILSIDANDLVIYCVASNTYCRRPTFISSKNHHFATLKCSPYNEHIFALGTAMGNVLVCDLRKMTIVHKFTGHKSKICGLAWREIKQEEQDVKKEDQLAFQAEQWRNRNGQNTEKAPPPLSIDSKPTEESIEVVDLDNQNEEEAGIARTPLVIESQSVEESIEVIVLDNPHEEDGGNVPPPPLIKSQAVDDSSDAFDIYNFDHLKEEFGAPSETRLTKSNDANVFVGVEKPSSKESKFDFIEACKSMKEDLKALKVSDNTMKPIEVTLQDCQEAKISADSPPRSDDAIESKSETLKDDDSSEGSLEVIQYSSSSDDAVIVDGDSAKPKREVLHHIYHQAEVHETPAGAEEEQPITTYQLNAPQMTRQESFDTISSVSLASASQTDTLLVSIDADEVIMIWNSQTGAHCGKNYSKVRIPGKTTIAEWLNDRTIVTLSRNQLFFWSLTYDDKILRYKFTKDLDRKCYQRDIATFSCSPTTGHIWVCMTTHRIALLDSLNGQLNDMIGNLSFGVRALVECPDDMNKIALGCADRRIALIDVFKLTTRNLIIDTIATNGAVFSIAWSPNCLSLAYGTGDGVIGIVDVERMKTREIFRTPQKNEIYSLAWCNNYVYFIVSRQFGYINLDKDKKGITILKYISRPSYFSIRGAFLLVGTTDGFLQLHERKDGAELCFQFVRQSALLSRYVTDIAWNPMEPQQFAIVGNDKIIYVMEFIESEKNWKRLNAFTASAPKASISSLKWSNTQSHLLLTFHIEGKVCLWSTKEPEQPPITISYHCPMWGGMFLPTNHNIIMSVGKTVTLELVNIKEADDKRNIQSKVDTLLNAKLASRSMNPPIVVNTSTSTSERKRNVREKKRLAMLELENQKALNESEQQEPQARKGETANELPENFPAHSRSCLYLVQKELNCNALDKLSIVLTEDSSKIDQSVITSKLFSTKVVAKDLVAAELTNLKNSASKNIAPLCLAVSTFKLREELERHMANQTLNEWHLSLAPSVSFMFWQDCCRAYAKQMENQGYFLHAATYLFGIGSQSEAINLLVDNEYYMEALLHARVCLPATDPIIKTIINKWLGQLEKTGNYAAAALICVLDNEMLRGYTYLRRYRNHTPELASIMDDIKRIGQLSTVLEGCVLPNYENHPN